VREVGSCSLLCITSIAYAGVTANEQWTFVAMREGCHSNSSLTKTATSEPANGEGQLYRESFTFLSALHHLYLLYCHI
jgi:hypothetical protein